MESRKYRFRIGDYRTNWLLWIGAAVGVAQVAHAAYRLTGPQHALTSLDAAVVLALLLAVAVHSNIPYNIEVGKHKASTYLDDPLVLPVVLRFGWHVGLVMVVAKAVLTASVSRRPWYKALYSVSANGLSYLLAEMMFKAISGDATLSSEPGRLVLGAVAAALIVPASNAPLIGLAIRVSQRGSGILPAIYDRRVFGFHAVEAGLAAANSLLMLIHSVAVIPLTATLTLILASWNNLALKRFKTEAFLRRLAQEVELRNPYSTEHSERVSQLAMEVGRKMSLSQDQVRNVGRAALWHDIGKISVPDMILLKTSTLNDRERALIEEHVRSAADLVSELDELGEVAEIISQHHERIDGKGYPEGLVGSEISTTSRVLAVVEAYDAMVTEQPYREAWTPARALAEIGSGIDSRYDRRVVEALAGLLGIRIGITGVVADTSESNDGEPRTGNRQVVSILEAKERGRNSRDDDEPSAD